MSKITFTAKVKNELSREAIIPKCCLKAQTYGLLLFGRSFDFKEISYYTENDVIADFYNKSIFELTNIAPQVKTPDGKHTLYIEKEEERRIIFNYFGHAENELTLRINRSNITDECCFGAFIRGVFISCGTVSSPTKSYHLEFVVPFLKLCNDLINMLQELGLPPGHIVRSGYHVLYYKGSEKIEDLLTLMGATDASLELMGTKIVKDMRNKVNRMVNSELANISRTVEASGKQISTIDLIEKKIGIDSLPPELRELAILRRKNPEATLSAIGKMLSKPLSRSGVNHRLKKIINIATELEQ